MALQEVLEQEGGSVAPSTSSASKAGTTRRIKLWDLPVRIFHWSLVAAVTTVIVTGKIGGDLMAWHGRAGIAIVGLLAFRLSWGFLGSTHARFTSFVPSPAGILSYLKGRWRGVGHNPLGALSVLALLFVLGVQVGTGLFSNDDIAFAGPLAPLVNEDLSHQLTSWHHQLVNVIFTLLGLHVAAIAFYLAFKKDNLVKPMVTGWKEIDVQDKVPAHREGGPVALVVSLLIAGAAVYGANGTWAHHSAAPSTSDAVSPAAATPAASPASSSGATPSW